jgi:hypothetical protein
MPSGRGDYTELILKKIMMSLKSAIFQQEEVGEKRPWRGNSDVEIKSPRACALTQD